MAHRRRQIRDAAVARVTGLATSGNRVTVGRVYPWALGELPSLDVMTPEESRSLEIAAPPYPQARTLTLAIECRASGDDYVNTLDTMALEVETAMGANRQAWNLLTDDVRLVGTTLENSNEVEAPIGALTLSFEIRYTVDSGDPQ